ncbi:MAG: SCO family protein [Gammaproteobacteria bacterium]|nr:SCO family protein [Gammaproteobacteria bacterium]
MLMLRRNTTLFIMSAVLIGTAITVFAMPQNSSDASQRREFEEVGARLLKVPIAPAPFTLTDHLGNTFTHERLSGAWNVVFFGYTHCADVCPTTLSTLARVEKNFAGKGEVKRPQFVFVSVDPKRDAPEVLRKYVAYFSPKVAGVTGSPHELRSLIRSLDSYYDHLDRATRVRVDTEQGAGGDDYLVEHPSDLYVFAPDGKQVGLIFPPFDAERVALVLAKFMQLTIRR